MKNINPLARQCSTTHYTTAHGKAKGVAKSPLSTIFTRRCIQRLPPRPPAGAQSSCARCGPAWNQKTFSAKLLSQLVKRLKRSSNATVFILQQCTHTVNMKL